MLNWFRKKKKDNKGFTLVELVIVVAILAILVGILAPQYTKYVEKSRVSADVANLEEIVKAIQVAHADMEGDLKNDEYTVVINLSGAAVNDTSSGENGDKALGDFLNSALGTNWQNKGLKSKRWKSGETSGGDDDQISATVTVDRTNGGELKIEYSKNVEKYFNSDVKTNPTT